MSETNQPGGTTTSNVIGDSPFNGKVAPAVEAVKAQGGQRAFCSVWDLHAYYGESYIVQGVSFDIAKAKSSPCSAVMAPAKPRPCVHWRVSIRPKCVMAKSGSITSRCTK